MLGSLHCQCDDFCGRYFVCVGTDSVGPVFDSGCGMPVPKRKLLVFVACNVQ